MFKELPNFTKRRTSQSTGDNGRSANASANVANLSAAFGTMSNQPEASMPQTGRVCKLRSMLLKLHAEMEPSSVQSVMQKLTYIAKTNALRFQLLGDDAKRRTKECSLNAAHFCVYFTLDVSPNGARNAFIEDVRVQLSNDVAQSCPELLDALRANHYEVLTQQVANLQSIYALKVESSQKNQAYACLNAIEKDLVTLFNATCSYFTAEVQSSASVNNVSAPFTSPSERLAHRLVFQGAIGCFQSRSGGRPATITYFVSAYDLIDVATKKMRPFTLESINNNKLGKSAYVTIEPSANGTPQRLTLVPLLSVRAARQSVSSSSASSNGAARSGLSNVTSSSVLATLGITSTPASSYNSTMLPAYFVLDLRGPLIATQFVVDRIEKLTELPITKSGDCSDSFVEALVESASMKNSDADPDSEASSNSTSSAVHMDCSRLIVRLREQRHCYTLSASSDARLFEPSLVRAACIRKVAFTRVTDLASILSLIRAQTQLNALLESLVRPDSNFGSSRAGTEWRMIRARVEYDSLTSVRCVFADPFRADTFASISINLSECGSPRCSLSDAYLVRVLESGRLDDANLVEPISNINEYLDTVLARSFSLPILVHAVYRRASRIATAQCCQQLAAECARIESDTQAHVAQVRRHTEALNNSAMNPALPKRQASFGTAGSGYAHGYAQQQPYGHSPGTPHTPTPGSAAYGMLSPLRMAVPSSPTSRAPFSGSGTQRTGAPMVSPVLQNILAGNSNLPPQSPFGVPPSPSPSATFGAGRVVDGSGKNERNPVLTSLLNQEGDSGQGTTPSPVRRPSGGALESQPPQLSLPSGTGRGKKRKASTAQSESIQIGEHVPASKRRISKQIIPLNDEPTDAYTLGSALTSGVAHSKLLPAVLTSTSLQHSTGASSAYGYPPASPSPGGPLSRLLSSSAATVPSLAPPPPVLRTLSTSSNLDDTFADVLSSVRSPDSPPTHEEDSGGLSHDGLPDTSTSGVSEPSMERGPPAETAALSSIATGSVLKGTKLIIPKNLSGLNTKNTAPPASGSNGTGTVTGASSAPPSVTKRERTDDSHSQQVRVSAEAETSRLAVSSSSDPLGDPGFRKSKPLGLQTTKKRPIESDETVASSTIHTELGGTETHIIVKKKLGRPRKVDSSGMPVRKTPFITQSSTGSTIPGPTSVLSQMAVATPQPGSSIRITIRDANRDKIDKKLKVEKKDRPSIVATNSSTSAGLSAWDAQAILAGQSANTDKLKNFRIPKKVKTNDDLASSSTAATSATATSSKPPPPATGSATSTPTPTTPAPTQPNTSSQSQPDTPETPQSQSQAQAQVQSQSQSQSQSRPQSRSAPFEFPPTEQRSSTSSSGRAPLLPTPTFGQLSTSPSQRAYGQVTPAHVNRVGRSPGHTQSPSPFAHDAAPLSRSNSVGNGAAQPLNLSTHTHVHPAPYTKPPSTGGATSAAAAAPAPAWPHTDTSVQPAGKVAQRDTGAESDASLQQTAAQRAGRKPLESVIDKLRTKSISGNSNDAAQSQSVVVKSSSLLPSGGVSVTNRRILREAEKDTPDSPSAHSASGPASPDPESDDVSRIAPTRGEHDSSVFARRTPAPNNLVRVLVSNVERPRTTPQRFMDEAEVENDRLTIVDEVGSTQMHSHVPAAGESDSVSLADPMNDRDARRTSADESESERVIEPTRVGLSASANRQSGSLSMLAAYSESSTESVEDANAL